MYALCVPIFFFDSTFDSSSCQVCFCRQSYIIIPNYPVRKKATQKKQVQEIKIGQIFLDRKNTRGSRDYRWLPSSPFLGLNAVYLLVFREYDRFFRENTSKPLWVRFNSEVVLVCEGSAFLGDRRRTQIIVLQSSGSICIKMPLSYSLLTSSPVDDREDMTAPPTTAPPICAKI